MLGCLSCRRLLGYLSRRDGGVDPLRWLLQAVRCRFIIRDGRGDAASAITMTPVSSLACWFWVKLQLVTLRLGYQIHHYRDGGVVMIDAVSVLAKPDVIRRCH